MITTWAALRDRGVSAAGSARNSTPAGGGGGGHAIALHNGPLTREQRWFVARAHGGPRALLTGFTAAEAFGLNGWQREPVDLLVPLGARRCGTSPVGLEVDGALHLDQRRWWDDQHRQNELGLGNAVVLRFPSAVVRTRPEVVAAQLRRALRL